MFLTTVNMVKHRPSAHKDCSHGLFCSLSQNPSSGYISTLRSYHFFSFFLLKEVWKDYHLPYLVSYKYPIKADFLNTPFNRNLFYHLFTVSANECNSADSQCGCLPSVCNQLTVNFPFIHDIIPYRDTDECQPREHKLAAREKKALNFNATVNVKHKQQKVPR